MKRLLGFIFVLLIAFTAFGQTKHIGIWGQYADTISTGTYPGEYWRICTAIDGGSFDWVKHDYWDWTAINAESLSLIDVFIVPEMERSSSTDSTTGAALGSILRPWVEAGGLLIGFFSHGARFINGAGFTPLRGSYTSTMSGLIDIVMPDHPMAAGCDPSFPGMNASYAYPTYDGWMAVATYPYSGSVTPYISAGFVETGSGCVVFFGWDYFDATTPNEDLLLQNTISFWGMRSEGPVLRSFAPEAGRIYSGYPTIRLEFQDPDGIDETSLQFYLNGVLHTGYSPIVSVFGDTVLVSLPDTLPDGEVSLRLRRIEDSIGNPGPDTSRVYTFIIDNTPPQLGYHEPTGEMAYMPDGALIEYTDAFAGTSADNWYIYFPGTDTIRNGTTGVICEGDTLVIVAFTLARINPTPDDTNWIEFGVWDTPDEGEPNLERYRWWFMPTVGIEENLPQEFEFTAWPNPFNSSVMFSFRGVSGPEGAQGQIGIEIYDITGKLIADLTSPSAMAEGLTPLVWTPGEEIGSGVYLVRINSGKKKITNRIVLLK